MVTYIQEMPEVARAIGEDVLPDVVNFLLGMASKTSGQVLTLIVGTAPLAAERLGDEDLFRKYLNVLSIMLAQAPRGLRPMLENLDRLLTQLTLGGLRRWVMWGAQAYKADFDGQVSYFSLQSADAMSVMMTALSGVLWFLTTLYAIAYLETSSQSRSRFFGFFSLCVSSTTGIALAGNLMTFLMFYEMLTLSTYPLVVHRGTPESMRAGRTYIVYTFGGGAAFLIGVAWLKALVGSVAFTEGGMLAPYVDAYATQLQFIFFLMIAGLGVKAALVPGSEVAGPYEAKMDSEGFEGCA